MQVASYLDASSTGRDDQKISHSTTVEPWRRISLVAKNKIAFCVEGSTSPISTHLGKKKSAKPLFKEFWAEKMENGMNSSCDGDDCNL